MTYAFKKRVDIESVLELVNNPQNKTDRKQGPTIGPTLTTGYLFLTPAAGIPARSGTTPGEADCTPYVIEIVSGTATMVELTNNAGAVQTVKVYNVFGADITGSAYITAKNVFGVVVADAEDCP